MKYRVLLFFLSISFAGFSQQVKVYGGFLSDSIKVGERTAFYISAHYPDSLDILFPDTLQSFGTFEFQRKVYFPTKTLGKISKDSTVYFLTTFNIDRKQALRLPVYQVNPRDCTVFQTNADSILITQLVTFAVDTIDVRTMMLKETSAYHEVNTAFNYPVVIVAAIVLVLTSLIGYALFGKRIRKYFRLKSLIKNHERFVESFSSYIQQLQAVFSVPVTESAVVTWKKYMEQLESRPYTRMTTREMIALGEDDITGKNLKAIDQVIYGHNTSVLNSLENLKEIAGTRFNKKVEEVKNG